MGVAGRTEGNDERIEVVAVWFLNHRREVSVKWWENIDEVFATDKFVGEQNIHEVLEEED